MNDFYQLFIAAILVAAAAVSTNSLSSDFRIAIAYISILLIPLITSIAMADFVSHYILGLLLVLLFIAQISIIFNNYRQTEKIKELFDVVQKQTENYELLLKSNREFISDMVHQIRTPLSVIMTNSSLIEMQSNKQVSPYITQINAAINILSNSYEDLAYIISNDTMEYKSVEIDLSDFLHERIDFFESIVHANEKTITTHISDGITITMNDTELERLIDNNISNAIKHSNDRSDIEVVLDKVDSEAILNIISRGETIRESSMIFDKNYTESDDAKRSLGLGLYMVKTICEKNNIRYSVDSHKDVTIFTYVFNV